MELQFIDAATAASFLPERKRDSHKGSCGTLLSVCGSVNMSGAAILAGRAAYKSGCGLVLAALPESVKLPLQLALPEAVIRPYEENAPELSLDRATAVLFGPGCSLKPYAAELFRRLLEKLPDDFPLVIDADGLTLLSSDSGLSDRLFHRSCTVLLPHPGEASRLLHCSVEEVKAMGPEAAYELARRYHAVCLLKTVPVVTLSPEGEGLMNATGNDGMATAGSGDVLAGVVGGLLAQGVPAFQAAACGAYYHGLAGDTAAESVGKAGLMASDICAALRMDRP